MENCQKCCTAGVDADNETAETFSFPRACVKVWERWSDQYVDPTDLFFPGLKDPPLNPPSVSVGVFCPHVNWTRLHTVSAPRPYRPYVDILLLVTYFLSVVETSERHFPSFLCCFLFLLSFLSLRPKADCWISPLINSLQSSSKNQSWLEQMQTVKSYFHQHVRGNQAGESRE